MSSMAAPLWAKHMRWLGVLVSPLLWDGRPEAEPPQQGAPVFPWVLGGEQELEGEPCSFEVGAKVR